MDGLNGMEAFQPDPKEMAELDQAAVAVMDEAQNIARSIVDIPTCKTAQKWCAERLTFSKHIQKTSRLAALRDAVHEIHAGLCKAIREKADPHELAVRKVVDPAITIFLNEQERLRQIEQQKADETARKRDEESRLARAEALAKQGKTAQADAVLEKPGDFVAPKIEPIKIQGRSQRKTWKVHPVSGESLIALIKAIAGGAVPIQAIEVNYSWLNRQAQLLDGHLTYSGVECYAEEAGSYRRSA